MRKNLTIYDAWFLALFCLKITVKPHFSWWLVFLPYILIPVEALAFIYLNKYWLRIVYWYTVCVIKVDNRIKIFIARRQAKKAYNRANQNKFKI